jgi:hypothetical protein
VLRRLDMGEWSDFTRMKTIGVTLAALLLPHIAVAETQQTLDASDYPAEVKNVLDEARSTCRESSGQVSDDP